MKIIGEVKRNMTAEDTRVYGRSGRIPLAYLLNHRWGDPVALRVVSKSLSQHSSTQAALPGSPVSCLAEWHRLSVQASLSPRGDAGR